MWYDETGLTFVPPSPNSPSLDMLTLYPGTCLIEGTNVSEGRGTTRPFEMIGAPWVYPKRLADHLRERGLDGVAFRPVYFTPTFGKHAGETCGGVHIHIKDRDAVHAVRIGLHLLDALRREHPGEFAWTPPISKGRSMIDLLAGTDGLRHAIDAGEQPDTLLQRWERGLPDFKKLCQSSLLY